MTLDEYQRLASRTINLRLKDCEIEDHAKCGIVGECGEILSMYQKKYQGHHIDYNHMMKEVGDMLWFIAELCTVRGWSMGDVGKMNIDKLIKRYPDGFEEKKSLNRKDNDL